MFAGGVLPPECALGVHVLCVRLLRMMLVRVCALTPLGWEALQWQCGHAAHTLGLYFGVRPTYPCLCTVHTFHGFLWMAAAAL